MHLVYGGAQAMLERLVQVQACYLDEHPAAYQYKCSVVEKLRLW